MADDTKTPNLSSLLYPGTAVSALLLAVGVFSFAAALRTQPGAFHMLFFGAAVGLSGVGIFLFAINSVFGPTGRAAEAAFKKMHAHAQTAALLSDGTGGLLCSNDAADRMFRADSPTIASALTGIVEDAPGLVYRLLRLAIGEKAAGEVVCASDGRDLYLSVTAIGSERFVWTCRQQARSRPPALLDIFENVPAMVVGADWRIISMNDAARAISDGARPRTPSDLTREERSEHGDFVHLTDATQTRVRVHHMPTEEERTTVIMLPVSADEIARALPMDFMDVLPVALARIDSGGRIAYLNRAARRLLGNGPAPGQPLAALVEGLVRPIEDRLSEMINGRGHNPTEAARVRSDGEERYIQLTLKRLELDGEVSVLAVMADATEFKALEAQFVQSQKMQAVGQLAGGMAHDFNNLLTAISGHCDLLLLRHPVTDPDYEDLIQINQNSARAAELVTKLLAFSRKQTMMPKVVQIDGVLRYLKTLLTRLLGERVTLRIDQDPDLPNVRIDERQIELVIMNLVVNARDAMPQGGDVAIRTTSAEYRQNTERDGATIPAGKYLRIEVTDTGSGIPDDTIGKIFEPFFTTKGVGKGTGLGLSTAYGIMKQTGGFIFANSKINLGTTFTLLLPAHAAPDVELRSDGALAPAPAPADLSGRGVILLVEDEDPVRSVAARALVTRGYKVLEAGTAEEALKILEDDGLHVDLFVSDVIMPGKDGPTWVKEARKKRPDAKVIFVSGYAEDVFDDGEISIPNATFLPKPFSLVELSHRVKEQIDA